MASNELGIKALKPWAKGPLELLKHAEGHFRGPADTDRRIALIGFDQAVEVSIEVFVRLHPRLRGIEIPRAQVDEALKNFHSKIEFLEKFADAVKLPDDISIESIVWYHGLRNELYHSGNGMVPERHVIEGARQSAIKLFTALFGYDALSDLEPSAKESASAPAMPLPTAGGNAYMDFLASYKLIEELLMGYIDGTPRRDGRYSTSMVDEFLEKNPAYSRLAAPLRHMQRIRNTVVHGGPGSVEEDELFKAAQVAEMIFDALTAGPPTRLVT